MIGKRARNERWKHIYGKDRRYTRRVDVAKANDVARGSRTDYEQTLRLDYLFGYDEGAAEERARLKKRAAKVA